MPHSVIQLQGHRVERASHNKARYSRYALRNAEFKKLKVLQRMYGSVVILQFLIADASLNITCKDLQIA